MRALILGCLVVALVGGCYAPEIAACQYSCPDGECPDGLACNEQKMCAATATTRCTPLTGCGWPGISNVDPCAANIAADKVTTDWTISTHVSVNTGDQGMQNQMLDMVPGGLVRAIVTQGDGSEVLVIAVQNLRVTGGDNGSLFVNGSRPLILLANGIVEIDDGSITTVSSALDGPGCLNGRGGNGFDQTAEVGGGGGGGGGFGPRVQSNASGAAGGFGAFEGGFVPMGSTPGLLEPGTETLVPLRGGCPGGKGGRHESGTAGEAGRAGGAFQLSAKTSLSIKGIINAPGLGGGNAFDRLSGGGGGGSGGAILLEAPTITFVGGALLCANGGGGGAGGMHPNLSTSGLCDVPIFPGQAGGDPTSSKSTGGGGATEPSASEPGFIGSMAVGATEVRGGGGGGGGLGRIRLNGMLVGTPSLESPRASLGTLPAPQ
ncbi:MAG: hypothetical protein H0T89_27715 [Deltaproteobacteria bacterium]|nr:hypothetical protein [Deltaproteobacteria bacterium]MDQ3296673.1 hypothetical protein [Myxococcota bacterium]